MRCTQCSYAITWSGHYWDAFADKAYPREFVRQWFLWEEGKLGDPELIYEHPPQVWFDEMLKDTLLTPEDLRSMNILEVGIGHGRVLGQVQKFSPAAYGVDFAKPPRFANLRPGSIFFANLPSIPFAPGQFDLVICRSVLQFTADAQQSFAYLAEQVRDGGTLYVAEIYEPGRKKSLLLRKLFPGSASYPELVRLGLAHLLGAARATVEAVLQGKLDRRSWKRAYGIYNLNVFDILSPRWTSVHSSDEVRSWFSSRGFSCYRRNPGSYTGVKQI